MKNQNITNEQITAHYQQRWGTTHNKLKWGKGPVDQLPEGFEIIEFPPSENRAMWTYATCGLARSEADRVLELHVFAPYQNMECVELLTIIAHFHAKRTSLSLNHTVNLGKSWLGNSNCTFALVSLPYLDGQELEKFKVEDKVCANFLWLVPITKKEVEFKKEHGIKALEDEFEKNNLNYLDVDRNSVF